MRPMWNSSIEDCWLVSDSICCESMRSCEENWSLLDFSLAKRERVRSIYRTNVEFYKLPFLPPCIRLIMLSQCAAKHTLVKISYNAAGSKSLVHRVTCFISENSQQRTTAKLCEKRGQYSSTPPIWAVTFPELAFQPEIHIFKSPKRFFLFPEIVQTNTHERWNVQWTHFTDHRWELNRNVVQGATSVHATRRERLRHHLRNIRYEVTNSYKQCTVHDTICNNSTLLKMAASVAWVAECSSKIMPVLL